MELSHPKWTRLLVWTAGGFIIACALCTGGIAIGLILNPILQDRGPDIAEREEPEETGAQEEPGSPEPTGELPPAASTAVLPDDSPLPPDPSFEQVGSDLDLPLPAGDPRRGEALFLGTELGPDGQVLGCQACHRLDGEVVVGPSLEGISERIPEGYESAAQYLHEAMVQPIAYIREGFQSVMPPYGDRLDAQSLADLIAFMLEQ